MADEESRPPSTSSAGERPRGGTAIIVPFRDIHPEQKRDAHLKEFIDRIPRLMDGHTSHIYVIEQSNDGRKFNRGKLLNIGFNIALKDGCEVFVFHDVDLIPDPTLVPYYSNRPKNPMHIARVWDRYNDSRTYIGGAVSFSEDDFKKINGFPNNFWGWGGEDDELSERIREVGLAISSPSEGKLEDLEAMDLQEKLSFLRQHRDWKCNVKQEVRKEHIDTWKENGLSSLDYDLMKEEQMSENATKFQVDVKLNGHWTDTTLEIAAEPGAVQERRHTHKRNLSPYRRERSRSRERERDSYRRRSRSRDRGTDRYHDRSRRRDRSSERERNVRRSSSRGRSKDNSRERDS